MKIVWVRESLHTSQVAHEAGVYQFLLHEATEVISRLDKMLVHTGSPRALSSPVLIYPPEWREEL